MRVRGHSDEMFVREERHTLPRHLPQTLLSAQPALLDVQQRPAQKVSHLLQRGGDLQQAKRLCFTYEPL